MSSKDPKKRDVLISKALSYLLRHGAVKEKLEIDPQGYVLLDVLLNHNRMKSNKVTLEDLKRIVKDNDKQRFTIKDDTWICANQGHTLKVIDDSNLLLMSHDELPKTIYHGTYLKNLPLIFVKGGGLSRMDRNHIHFTSTEFRNISGIRKSVNVLIFLDVEKCVSRGLQFYKSLNDVILCKGDAEGFIQYELFGKVVDAKTGLEIDITEFTK